MSPFIAKQLIPFFTSSVRTGMTFLYGSTGETLTEKSGQLNLGIPGVMSVGAAFGCMTVYLYSKAVGGKLFVDPNMIILLPILASFIGGMLMGIIYSFLTVTLHANQNVTGLVLTTFGLGVTGYMIEQIETVSFAAKYIAKPMFEIDKDNWFGELVGSYGILIYLSLIIALVVWFIFTKTKVGLNLRAVGEDPAAADAAGININRYQYVSAMIGSGIAGLGGLCYIMDNLYGNWEYSIEKIGWLSIALVIFTLWNPNIGIFGSIIFGILYNLPFHITMFIKNVSFPVQDLVKGLPYVVTILVLVITSMMSRRENQPPAHLGMSYFREER